METRVQIDDYETEMGLYLVQTMGPTTAEWEQALSRVGSIVGYYPENTFLIAARTEHFSSGVLAVLPGVQHASVYQPAFKIRHTLLEEEGEVDGGDSGSPFNQDFALYVFGAHLE